jgi:hypothetical protein
MAKASFTAQVGPTATGLRTVTGAIDDVSTPIIAFASMTCALLFANFAGAQQRPILEAVTNRSVQKHPQRRTKYSDG